MLDKGHNQVSHLRPLKQDEVESVLSNAPSK